MRPAWLLATNNLSARRNRTALLVATVALCSALITAVACAMASVHKAISMRVDGTVGAADLRVRHVGGQLFDVFGGRFNPETGQYTPSTQPDAEQAILDTIKSWPNVRQVVARGQGVIRLTNPAIDKTISAGAFGVIPDQEYNLRTPDLVEGRLVQNRGEIAIDKLTAKNLGVGVGDTLQALVISGIDEQLSRLLDRSRSYQTTPVEVVGVVKQPAMGMLDREIVYVTLATLSDLARTPPGHVREIDITLAESSDPAKQAEQLTERFAGTLPEGLILQPTARITSGLTDNMRASNIGLIVASSLSFLSAAFIIMTGLSTNVTERQRELAIIRCIGGSKSQLAGAQVLVGLIVGVLGAAFGVPLGLLGSAVVIGLFPDVLPGGWAVSGIGLVTAFVGAAMCGVLGAAWPAFRAAATSPLGALAIRASRPNAHAVWILGVIGVAFAALHVLGFILAPSAELAFWINVTLGLPALFTGYFLVAVPITRLAGRIAAPALDKLLALPKGLLAGTIEATPYRHGFTAGAMMLGLALLVGIWTNGRSIMRDWLDAMDFPDAFVSGILTKETQRAIEQIPGVVDTCAITIQPMGTDAFSGGLHTYSTTFLAFEPDRFFRITTIEWVEGSLETALPKLNQGGHVLVAREFSTTRGYGLGDTITLTYNEQPYDFTIAGVVTSPGLEIVSKFFDIGEDYLNNSVNAVFGSRDDLIRLFGNTAINLIQIDIDDDVEDAEAIVDRVRDIAGFGIAEAGSGKAIKDEIKMFIGGSLLIFSVVAVCAMLVSCLGVANVIVAGIQARQFEFGVLRAVGAQRGLLTRLILGEAILIAITACVLGTIMGVQVSWGGQRIYELVLGLDLSIRIPPLPTAAGWLTVTTITLGAAAPAAWRLSRRKPRELLGAMKG